MTLTPPPTPVYESAGDKIRKEDRKKEGEKSRERKKKRRDERGTWMG